MAILPCSSKMRDIITILSGYKDIDRKSGLVVKSQFLQILPLIDLAVRLCSVSGRYLGNH